MVSVCIVGCSSIYSISSIKNWLVVAQIASAREAWLRHIQTAQLWALRNGQSVVMQRLSTCAVKFTDAKDWRCGWGVYLTNTSNATQQLILENQLDGRTQINLYSAQT